MWKKSLMASEGQRGYFLILVASLLVGLFLSACSSLEPNLKTQIYGGSPDTSTVENDAVVWVGGCTGTLVANDLVLTAGHCGSTRPDPASYPDLVSACADWEDYRIWYPSGPREIRVGRDKDHPVFTTNIHEYSLPGCADMILLRLDEPVPARFATPMKVMSYVGDRDGGNDVTYFAGDRFKMAGWGLVSAIGTPNVWTSIRQQTLGNYFSHNREKFYIEGIRGSHLREGDSGSPLIWNRLRGDKLVIGVAQGYDSGSPVLSRYYATFRNEVNNGSPERNYPSVRRWIEFHLGCETPWTVFDDQFPRSSMDSCTYEMPHCLWGDCEVPPEMQYNPFPECPLCGFKFTLPEELKLAIGIKLPELFENLENLANLNVTLLNSVDKPIGESKIVAQTKGHVGNYLMLYADLVPDTYTFKINLSAELAKQLDTEGSPYSFDVNFQNN